TTEPTDIRCLCLRGLPVILGDDPSAFFKTCSDATDQDSYIQLQWDSFVLMKKAHS
ncbi:sterile alpha motif domain-containing protein 3-like protein, partial [Lates japonicus]